jgi:hypothetical protein
MGDGSLMLLLDTNVWFKRYWRLPLPVAMERRLEQEDQFTLVHTDLVIRQRGDLRQAYFNLPGMGC